MDKKDVAKELAKEAVKAGAKQLLRTAASGAFTWTIGLIGYGSLPVILIFIVAIIVVVLAIIIVFWGCQNSSYFQWAAEVTSWTTWTTSICDIIKQ